MPDDDRSHLEAILEAFVLPMKRRPVEGRVAASRGRCLVGVREDYLCHDYTEVLDIHRHLGLVPDERIELVHER
jgi:hypothetical protein